MQQVLTYIFLVLSFVIQAQLKNFGTKAKRTPEPNFMYGVYAYYDVVRERGIGFQIQLGNKYNIDVSTYMINKNIAFKNYILQWDYYDLQGYGFSVKPKFLIGRFNRFYVGANFACEFLHHDKEWVDYSYSDDYRLYKLEEAKGVAYTIGLTLGNKIRFNRYFIEPFAGIGYTSSEKITATAYSAKGQNANPNNTYPHTESYDHGYFQLNLGIKLGISFKKSKKQEAVMAKIELYYLPLVKKTQLKTDSLYALQGSFSNRYIKSACSLLNRANSAFLRKYRKYYNDSTKLYRKIDEYFLLIDEKIKKGTEASIK